MRRTQLRKIDDFYVLSKEYCDYMETVTVDRAHLIPIMSYLVRIFDLALRLPQVKGRDYDQISYDREDGHPKYGVTENIEVPDTFWVVFSPDDNESICSFSVREALWELSGDLSDGNYMYEDGRPVAACFHWKTLFMHWGRHLLEVLVVFFNYETVGVEPEESEECLCTEPEPRRC